MWLDNLREIKTEKQMTNKQISEASKLPIKTIDRIFSGATPNPYADTLDRVVKALGSSLDYLFSDTNVVVGTKDLVTLQEENDRLTAENEELVAKLELLSVQLTTSETTNVSLKAENEVLRNTLAHKEEIIAIHNYYIKLKSNG